MWTTEEKQTLMLAILDTLSQDEAQNPQQLIMRLLESLVLVEPSEVQAEIARLLGIRERAVKERLAGADKVHESNKAVLRDQEALCASLRDRVRPAG